MDTSFPSSFASYVTGKGFSVGSLTQSQFSTYYTAWLTEVFNNNLVQSWLKERGYTYTDGGFTVSINQNSETALPTITYKSGGVTYTIDQQTLDFLFGSKTEIVVKTGNVTQERYYADFNKAPDAEADRTVTVLEDSGTTPLGITAPKDADSNSLVIKITGLPDPAKGMVYLSDGTTAVTNGQTLTAEQLTGLVFKPAADVNGAAGTFSYSVSDGLLSDTQTITLGITAVNDAPTAASNAVTTLEDNGYTFAVSEFGFSDLKDAGDAGALANVIITTLPAHGTLKLDGVAVTQDQAISATDIAAGKLVFVPADDENGTGYATFGFKVQDGGGTDDNGADTSIEYTMTVNVTAVNDAPDLTGPQAALQAGTEDQGYTVSEADLLAGFTDVDGDILAVESLTADHGSVSFNAETRIFTITPDANYNGAVTLHYTVVDGNGGSVPATQSVTLAETNDAPTTGTVEDQVVAEDGAIASINVLNGASAGPLNESSQTLSVTSASALHGDVTINPDGTLSYTAHENYFGPDTISYTVSDNGTTNGAADPKTATGTIAVTVTEINDAPTTASVATQTVAEDGAIASIDVLSGASAGPLESSQTLSVTSYSAQNGTVSVNADGTLKYVPNANYFGSDTISYTIVDDGTTNGLADPRTATGTVAVTVTAVNDTPELAAVAGHTYTDTVNNDSFLAHLGQLQGTDIDGDELTYNLAGAVASDAASYPAADGWVQKATSYGTLYLNSDTGAYEFIPLDGAIEALTGSASVSFSFTANDGAVSSAARALVINLEGVQDAPEFGGTNTGSVTEDSVANASGSLTVTDRDAGESGFQAVTAAELKGIYGDFTFNSQTGAWTYALRNGDANVQALTANDHPIETLVIHSNDGGEHVISVTVNGADEVVVTPPQPKVMDFDSGSFAANGSSYTEESFMMARKQGNVDVSLAISNYDASAGGDKEAKITKVLNNGGQTVSDTFEFKKADSGAFSLVSVEVIAGAGEWLGYIGDTRVAQDAVTTTGLHTFDASEWTGVTRVEWVAQTTTGQVIDNLFWI